MPSDDDLEKLGMRRDEGSPVSVLDLAMAMRQNGSACDETDSERSGELIYSDRSRTMSLEHVAEAEGCFPAETLQQRAAMGGEEAARPVQVGQPSSAAADASLELINLSTMDIVGDVAGMEQDFEYVRHVLLISGFGGAALPPIFSRTLPINPVVFEQLEFEILGDASLAASAAAAAAETSAYAGSAAGRSSQSYPKPPSASSSTFPLPNFVVCGQNTSEERRQRMLLFDAVN